MIDKIEKVARMKGAVYDVHRREPNDGEGGSKKENFKRMLESAMEKNKKSREKNEEAAIEEACRLDVTRATQSLFYRSRQMLDLPRLVSRIHAG